MSASPAASTDNRKPLFTKPDGRSLEFFIDRSEEDSDKYAAIILENGGVVHSDQSALLSPEVIHLSRHTWNNRNTMHFQYVDDALRTGIVPYLPEFQLVAAYANDKKRALRDDFVGTVATVDRSSGSPSGQVAGKKKPKTSKTTTKFTPEADMYILEQVRMKPRFRTSHKFFEELARHEPLHGHTGNSVRSRYRLQLESKLGYVYKTDNFDQLVLDENGQRLAIPVESAKTMKTKFTAQDDFDLCNDIIDYVVRNQDPLQIHSTGDSKYPLDENKFSVSILFFDQYATEHPNHSSSSWRDRYRKFARVHGLQRYRDEFIISLGTKEGPKPMGNLTLRPDPDERVKKLRAREEKKAKKNAEADNYSRNGGAHNVHHAHNALTAHASAMHHPQLHDIDPLSGQMDASAAAAVANMAVASRESNALASMAGMTDKNDTSINANINSNIHEALRGVGVEAGRVNIEDDMVSIHPTLAAHSHRSVHDEDNAFGDIGIKDTDSQDPLSELEYLPPDCNAYDLFQGLFYEQESKKILERVFESLVHLGNEDVEKISEALESYGFTRKFVGHIIRVTSAHAGYMNDYLTHVFRILGLEKWTVDDILFIRGKDGFWTPETDEALSRNDYEALSHMSERNMNLRRSFLGIVD